MNTCRFMCVYVRMGVHVCVCVWVCVRVQVCVQEEESLRPPVLIR